MHLKSFVFTEVSSSEVARKTFEKFQFLQINMAIIKVEAEFSEESNNVSNQRLCLIILCGREKKLSVGSWTTLIKAQAKRRTFHETNQTW